MAVVADQGIALRLIHQRAHLLRNAASNTVIALDIAHPLFVDFLRPVRTNRTSCGQPHEEVSLRCRIKNTGVQHDNRRHGQ